VDPSVDRIIPQKAKVIVVKGNNSFGITDGNTWVSEGNSGYLLFSDIIANAIFKYTPDTNNLSIFLSPSGFTGSLGKGDMAAQARGQLIYRLGTQWVYNFGSNGIALDPQGRIVFCSQGDGTVVRLEKDGTRTVLASEYQGQRLDSPNKLVITSNGTIYFSDVCFATKTCAQPYRQGFYMLKDGNLRLLQTQGHGPALSPDEKYLYLTGVPNGIMRYEIQPDGTLANGHLFVDMSGEKPAPGGPDGITVDRDGNVYSGGPGGLWIINPEGKHIGTILFPLHVINVALGDRDLKTLYILDQRDLLKIRLRVPGVLHPLPVSTP
jgi:gluconolactonase